MIFVLIYQRVYMPRQSTDLTSPTWGRRRGRMRSQSRPNLNRSPRRRRPENVFILSSLLLSTTKYWEGGRYGKISNWGFVSTVGRGLRFSRNDRMIEAIKLLLYGARLPIHSSSQSQGETTQSVNFTTVSRIPLKTFLYGKNDYHSLEKVF